MDKNLLDIICCPVTRLPLEILDVDRLESLNAAIQAGDVRNNAEELLTAGVQEALVSRDGRFIYPVRDGIPILMEEESISWRPAAD
jgi:uncharacterized protein YbaR (Trm112 family)